MFFFSRISVKCIFGYKKSVKLRCNKKYIDKFCSIKVKHINLSTKFKEMIKYYTRVIQNESKFH